MNSTIAALALVASPAIAAPTAPMTVTEITDGDTFTIVGEWAVVAPAPARRIFFRIPGPVKVRVLDIDTPEKGWRAKCPEEAEHSRLAKEFATATMRLAGMAPRLDRIQHDKFGGRIDAEPIITIARKSAPFAEAMIEAGFARAYTGEGPKPDWCAILKQGVQ